MRRTVLAAGAAALAIGLSPAARADAVFNVPIAGTVRVQSGFGCGVNGDDPCDSTTSFTGTLAITLPSSADGDYFAAGLTFLLDGVGHPVTFTSPTDHAGEAVIRGGYLTSYFANGGDSSGAVFCVMYGDGANTIYYDEPDPHSDFTVNAVRVVPEPPVAWMMALGAAFLLRGRRWPGRQR
jgi:hypothetical protein